MQEVVGSIPSGSTILVCFLCAKRKMKRAQGFLFCLPFASLTMRRGFASSWLFFVLSPVGFAAHETPLSRAHGWFSLHIYHGSASPTKVGGHGGLSGLCDHRPQCALGKRTLVALGKVGYVWQNSHELAKPRPIAPKAQGTNKNRYPIPAIASAMATV